jgi:hypothetical protein
VPQVSRKEGRTWGTRLKTVAFRNPRSTLLPEREW